jgi:exopolysaccharide production protein ExoQ
VTHGSSPASLPSAAWTGWFATAVLVLSTGAFFAIPTEGGEEAGGAVIVLWSVAYLVATVVVLDGALRERLALRVPASLVVFLALAVSSVAWSAAAEVTARRSVGLLGTVMVGLLLAQRLEPVEIFDAVRRAMVIVAVISLLLWVVGDPRAIDPVHDSLRGIVATKNTLGRVMGLGLLAAAMSAFIDPARRRRALLAAVPMGLALGLTGSAGGALIAVLVLGSMAAALLWSVHAGRILLAGAAVLALGVVTFVAPSTSAEDVVALVGRDLTLTGRTEIWGLSLDAVMQRPLLGYGYGAFWHEQGPIESARIAALLYWPVPNAHNGVLDVALELGAVGAVLAVAILGGLLVRGILDARAGRRQAATIRLSIGLLALVSNLVESSFLQENAFLTIVLVAALAVREPVGLPAAARTSPAPATPETNHAGAR